MPWRCGGWYIGSAWPSFAVVSFGFRSLGPVPWSAAVEAEQSGRGPARCLSRAPIIRSRCFHIFGSAVGCGFVCNRNLPWGAWIQFVETSAACSRSC
jgi:hypothetical protein